jgi:acyl homoserine lactone synthase
MSVVSMGNCLQLGAQVLSLMHAFRHEVFVKRLKWSLPLLQGEERDEYDTADAKYVIVSEGSVRVTACARLLPTTQAYMLPDLFPQLLGGMAAPRDSAIWELSRFATSVRETREGRVLAFSKPTLEFLDLILDFARCHDITRLLFVTSVQIERLMLRSGLPVHRIAPPAVVDGRLTVALSIETAQQQSPVSSATRFQGDSKLLADLAAALALGAHCAPELE